MMLDTRFCRRAISKCPWAVVGVFTMAMPGQVPHDFLAVSRFQNSATALGGVVPPGTATTQAGGITLVALQGGVQVDIAGLPPELVGTGVGVEGCASVLVEPRGGGLVVGEHCLPGSLSEIHVITLAGFTVASDLRYELGTSLNSGYADQMAWFGDDIVFAVRGGGVGLSSGIMYGHLIGVLRPRVGPPGTPGTVVPVPLTFNPSGVINALAVDEARATAYFAKIYWQSGVAQATDIYSVGIPGDGTPAVPTPVATVSGMWATNMACETDGTLLVAGYGGGGVLHRVDPNANPVTVTAVPTALLDVNGLSLENATGTSAVVEAATGQVYVASPGGLPVVIGSVGGVPSGVAYRQSMQTYGAPSPGANRYDWVLLPNPGGEPRIGNQAFSLTIASSPGTAIGIGALSLGAASLPIPPLGIELLLDPASLVPGPMLLPGSQVAMPFPLPNNPLLIGQSVHAQTIYVEPAQFAASRGMRFEILP